MVHFTNITFDDEWVYADAYNCSSKVQCKVKINRKSEQFFSNYTDNGTFNKAMLYVLIDVEDGKLEQNSERVVNWG